MKKVVKCTQYLNYYPGMDFTGTIQLPVGGEYLSAHLKEGMLTMFYMVDQNNYQLAYKEFTLAGQDYGAYKDTLKHLATFEFEGKGDVNYSYAHLFVLESD